MKNKLKILKENIVKLLHHQGVRRYGVNTGWLFAEKILRMTVGLFVGVWVARYLGPAKYGLFSYAQSFVALFTAVATLGLDGIVVRELVKDEKKRDILLGTAFVLKLIGAIVVLILLRIAVGFTSNARLTNILIFIIASATIFQSFNVIDFYFQSKVLSKYVVFANIISLFLSSLLKIYFILTNKPLLYFAIMVVFDNFILALGFIYFYTKQKLSLLKWKFNKEEAKRLLHDSWPLILSGIMVSIYMRIDQIMIKGMLGNEAVGQYAAAVRISTVWYFIPIVITNSLFPAIINAKKIGKKLYYARLQRLYTLMLWTVIGIALPMTFLSNLIVNLLYGVAYKEAGSVLMIYIWAGVFVSLSVVRGKEWLSDNNIHITMISTIIGAIINAIANYFFILKIGITGAAWATLSARVFTFFIIPLLFVKYIHLNKVIFISMISPILEIKKILGKESKNE